MSKVTEIVCILDRSGSMSGSEQDVIGGFNSFIQEQKKVKGKARVSLVLFDHEYDVVLDRVKLKKVKPMTEFVVRGSTGLNDAIGNSITRLGKAKKAIFLIQTDGGENSSREFTTEAIKTLVEKKESEGWEFIFAGTGLSEFSVNSVSQAYGMKMSNTIAVGKGQDFAKLNSVYAATTVAYRAGASLPDISKQSSEGTGV